MTWDIDLDFRSNAFTVFFDACVFYSAPIRDIILQLASDGLFRARWSKKVQDEWMSNLLKNRPELTRIKLENTIHLMNNTVLDCLVEGYEEIEKGIFLPDPKDSHVLAAAIKTQAQVIVTFNLKDFPQEIAKKYAIEIQHPDTFLKIQMDLNHADFLSSIKAIRSRLKKPPRNAEEYLSALLHHLPLTYSNLKKYENLI